MPSFLFLLSAAGTTAPVAEWVARQTATGVVRSGARVGWRHVQALAGGGMLADMGSHYAIRTQRVVLQEWKVATPWAAA